MPVTKKNGFGNMKADMRRLKEAAEARPSTNAKAAVEALQMYGNGKSIEQCVAYIESFYALEG